MEKKIKEILESKDLDAQFIGLDRCNKPKEFLKNYHEDTFKRQTKNFCNGFNRDEKGFILLDDVPFIRSLDEPNWLVFNNGTKVYLKKPINKNVKQNGCAIEQEILVEFFLRALNINTLRYEPASLNGKNYLISPSFLDKDDMLLNPFDPKYDIESSQKLARMFGNETNYLKTLFVDRIYGNSDRFGTNYGIIFRNDSFKTCPLYDNGEFLFDRTYKDFPKLKNGSNDMNEVIAYLLENDEIMHWVTHILKKANLFDVANRIEREKGFFINNSTYESFENFFKDSEIIINEELKNKNCAPCIKLT